MALQTTLFDHSEIIADFSLLYKEVVHALWWNQPFASLMLHGKIETRTNPTKVRGKVLICSCKKHYFIWQVMEIAKERQYNRIYNILGELWQLLPLGKAIAVADLVDCRPMTKEYEDSCYVSYKDPWIEERKVYDKKAKAWKIKKVQKKLWCWIFENVQEIEPFNLDGKQGWGILDEETKKKIKPIALQPLTAAIAPVVE